MNEQALEQYLSFQYVPAPQTMFQGIYSLMPGSYLYAQEGRLMEHRYWEPDFQRASQPKGSQMTMTQTADSIEACIRKSMRLHRRSDVDIGICLSGGVDSNYLASFLPDKKSFTVGFLEGTAYDETSQVRKNTSCLSGIHKEYSITRQIWAVWMFLIWYDMYLQDGKQTKHFANGIKPRKHGKESIS